MSFPPTVLRSVVLCLLAGLLVASGIGVTAAKAQRVVSGEADGDRQINRDIQLVGVQMTLDLEDFWTRDAFEAKIRHQMEAVAAVSDPELPTLVVFPEDVGLMLVVQGMKRRLAGITSIEEAIQKSVIGHLLPLTWTKLVRGVSWVPALFLHKDKIIAETYFDVFSKMAREYGVYLVAGSVVLPPYAIEEGEVQWRAGPTEHRVYNTSYFFGPDGKVIGKQDKVYLIDLEQEAALDLTSGRLDDLQVYDTPLGKIGIAICLDAFQDDVIEALVAQGAQILVQPTANPGPWSREQQEDWLRSSYNKVAVDGSFAYAVNPMMNGPLWDIAFFGQSSIVARAAAKDTTNDTSHLGYTDLGPAPGFIAMAASDRSEEIVVAIVPHPDDVGND